MQASQQLSAQRIAEGFPPQPPELPSGRVAANTVLCPEHPPAGFVLLHVAVLKSHSGLPDQVIVFRETKFPSKMYV